MSPSTALQKRKRVDAHEGDAGSARGTGQRQDEGESVEASAEAVTPQPGPSASPSTSSDRGSVGLEFATESWTGRKPTNEDRSALCIDRMYPLGPAFAIYDGHGGTFTADFLVRNLFKAVAASTRHQIGGRTLQQLDASTALSHSESVRRNGIRQQVDFVTTQLKQVAQLMSKPTAADSEAKDDCNEEEDEVQALKRQLKYMLRDLESEAQRIGDEEIERTKYRCQWFKEQDVALQRAIVDAFKHTDEQILRKNSSRDGSTALVLCFFGGVTGNSASNEDAWRQDGCVDYKPTGFYALNLGDCRVVLYRHGGAVIRLTNDHKPDRPDEKSRIEKAGGFVGTFSGIPRVFSAAGAGLAAESELSTFLAVSRAFGDRPLKTPSALVSCEPEIRRYELDPDDLFIVMACDGVWDVLSDKEAVSIARRHLQDPKAAAVAVVKAAYMKGSADNLTATVIKLSEDGEPAKTQNLMMSSGHRSFNNAGEKSRPRGTKVDDQAGAVLPERAIADTNRGDNAQVEAEDEIDMFSL